MEGENKAQKGDNWRETGSNRGRITKAEIEMERGESERKAPAAVPAGRNCKERKEGRAALAVP